MLGNIFTSLPGMGTTVETLSNEFRWGPGLQLNNLAGLQLDAAARDAGSTPTTTLRSGLLLGTITATNTLTNYSATATDGSQIVTGILCPDVNILDRSGTAVNQFVWVATAGPVKPAFLYGFDETARSQMATRFEFDDRGFASTPGTTSQTLAKTANYTVVNGTDNFTTFTNEGAAGTVVYTLPTTLVKGQRWKFVAEANFAIQVVAPAGKLVAFNNAAATSVAFSTASQIIGGTVEITVNADGTKYLVSVLSSGNTVTVA